MITINKVDLFNKLYENPFKSMTEALYEILLSEILNFNILPESVIVEAHIAEFFNISRSPVREAIQLLEKDGFVIRNYKKSAIVEPFSAKDYFELTNFRYIIEPQAAGYASLRISDHELKKLFVYAKNIENAYRSLDYKSMLDAEDEFHEYIVLCSQNRYLIEAYNSIKTKIKKYRVYITANKNTYDFIIREHYIIFDSIKYKNKDTAETALKRHISILLGKSEVELKKTCCEFMQKRLEQMKKFL